MAEKNASIIYSFFGIFWRLALAAGIVFALTGAGSYFLAERLIERPEAPAPNLLTLELTEALERASQDGFSLIIEKHEPTDLLAAGRVLSQRPAPDIAVKQGATIRVTVAEKP
jgi:beta-lactam-binding protein with PASTA domain